MTRPMTFTVLVTLLLLSGCGRRSKAPTALNNVVVPITRTDAQPLSETQATAAYQGQTAEQWAVQLASPTQMTRHQAADALGRMDEAGFSHLLKGMHSRSPEVRRTCLCAMYKPVLIKHEREVFPTLVNYLKDGDPALRVAAITRLAWLEKRGGPAIPHLQRVLATESDPQVCDAARAALYQLSVAMSPTPPRHEYSQRPNRERLGLEPRAVPQENGK
jgi:hypothetical protein